MKKAATLVAGLLLVTGTVFAEGFSYDFSGTNVKYEQSFYDSAEGTFVTKEGDSEVKVNFNLTSGNTKVTLANEFDKGGDAGDALGVKVSHTALDGMIEVAVGGDLNFGKEADGFTTKTDDSVFLKYKPKSVEGLTIGFFPYDLPFKLEVDDYVLENAENIPGIEVVYNDFTFRFGSRQVYNESKDPTNRFYGQAAYKYTGEGFGFGVDALFSTQDANDTEWNQTLPSAVKYALQLKANADLTDVIKVEGEVLTGKGLAEDADAGFATRVKGSYTLNEFETPEGTVTTSTYAEVKYMDKNSLGKEEGRTKLEVGAEAKINEVTIAPNFSYTQEKDAKDFNGDTTDANYAFGVTLKYSI